MCYWANKIASMFYIVQEKSKESLSELGGVSGLAEALRCNINSGLDTQSSDKLSIRQRQCCYGANEFKEVGQKAFLALFSENLKDPTLILLMAAALVSNFITCMHA